MAFFELEQAILTYHAIDDCLVLDRSTPGGTIEPVAYVVAMEPFDREALLDHVASVLPSVSLPHIVRIDTVPTTPDGRVDEGTLASTPCLDSALCHQATEKLKSKLGVVDAVAGMVEKEVAVPHVHLHDLRPTAEWRVEGDSGTETSPEAGRGSGTDRPSEEPAILDGGPLDTSPVFTLVDLFERATTTWPDRGLHFLNEDLEETFLSYEGLGQAASGVLTGLRGMSMAPGDPVILDLPDREAFLTTFWACILGGFVPVPVSGAASVAEGSESDEALVRTWDFLGRPLIVREGREASRPDGSNELASAIGGPPLFGWFDDLNDGKPLARAHRPHPDDPALIVMTSGSTGEPKGVVLSHRTVVAQAAGTHQLLELTPADVFVNVMPLEHVGGIILTHVDAVLQGCSQIQIPTTTLQSDPLRWLDVIHERRGSVTWVPNFVIGLVLERVSETGTRDWDLSCLRHLLNGSEPVVPSTTREFVRIMSPHGFEEDAMEPVWGMSETAAGVVYSRTYSLSATADEDPNTALGFPIPGLALRIVDQEDEVLGRTEVGHVQIKGPAVSSTYFKRADLAEEVLTADGWFRTGDLGSISNEGLTLTGRSKDIIILNGVNYGSHEIEAAVESLDDVLPSFTAAVSVQAGPAFSDRLAVFFSPKQGLDGLEKGLLQEIQRAIAARVGSQAEFLVPVAQDEIPKTGIGKIRRSALKDRFEEGGFRDEVRRADLLLQNGRAIPNRLFVKRWKQKKLRPAHPRSDEPSVVVFVTDTDVELAVVDPLKALGWRCVVVWAGPEFQALEHDRFLIHPDRPGDYATLAGSLRTSGLDPEATLHLWSLGRQDSGKGYGREEETQTFGALSLVRWVQALNTTRAVRDHRIVIGTRDLFGNGSQGAADLRKGPLLGFAKAFPLEFSGSRSRVVDLGDLDGSSLGSSLATEVSSTAREDEVHYADRVRWVRTLERVPIPAVGGRPLPFRKGGRYVLLGGSGPVGRELTRRLRQQYEADVHWIGRRGPTDVEDDLGRPQIFGAHEDASRGSLTYSSVDIGDGESLLNAILGAESAWGHPVDGILHLAGETKPQTILETNPNAFRAGLRAKLDGMTAVTDILVERPSCHFIGFSSVVSFLGGAGLGTFSGASSSLEIATRSLPARDGGTRMALSWAPWRMAPRSDREWQETFEANPLFFQSTVPLAPELGWDYLVAALQSSEPLVLAGLNEESPAIRRLLSGDSVSTEEIKAYVVAEGHDGRSQIPDHVDLADRFGVPTSISITQVSTLPLLLSGSRLATTRDPYETGSPFVAPRNEMEREMSDLWTSILNLEKVGIHDHFFDLGGNSLAATQLVSRIRSAFGVDVPLRSVFLAPTIERLSLEILRRRASSLDPRDLGRLLAILEGES